MADELVQVRMSVIDEISDQMKAIQTNITASFNKATESVQAHSKSVGVASEYMDNFEHHAKRAIMGLIGFEAAKKTIDFLGEGLIDAGLNTEKAANEFSSLQVTIGKALLPDVQNLLDHLTSPDGLTLAVKIVRDVMLGFKELDTIVLLGAAGIEQILALIPGKGKAAMQALSDATVAEAHTMQDEIKKAWNAPVVMAPAVKSEETLKSEKALRDAIIDLDTSEYQKARDKENSAWIEEDASSKVHDTNYENEKKAHYERLKAIDQKYENETKEAMLQAQAEIQGSYTTEYEKRQAAYAAAFQALDTERNKEIEKVKGTTEAAKIAMANVNAEYDAKFITEAQKQGEEESKAMQEAQKQQVSIAKETQDLITKAKTSGVSGSTAMDAITKPLKDLQISQQAELTELRSKQAEELVGFKGTEDQKYEILQQFQQQQTAMEITQSNQRIEVSKKEAEMKTQFYLGTANRFVDAMATIARETKANAETQRDIAYTQAVINTAVAITKDLSQYGGALAIPFIALDVAEGVAQEIAISNQKFRSGTDFAPGGWATVGEDGPEQMYVPRGSQIYNNRETRNSTSNTSLTVHLHDDSGNIVNSLFTQLKSGNAGTERLFDLFSSRLN